LAARAGVVTILNSIVTNNFDTGLQQVSGDIQSAGNNIVLRNGTNTFGIIYCNASLDGKPEIRGAGWHRSESALIKWMELYSRQNQDLFLAGVCLEYPSN